MSHSGRGPADPGRRRFLTVVGGGLLGAVCTACAAKVSTSVTTTSPSTRPPSTTTSSTLPTTTPVGPSATSTTTAPAPPTTITSTSTEPPPPAVAATVWCRAAWGAQPLAGAATDHAIERITLHHTASVLGSVADAPAAVRGHQRFHQRDRGWIDLAYHFVVDPAGNVYEGRPVSAVGDTATDYDPTGHLLISLEGNYDRQDVTDDQLAAVTALCAWGCGEFDVDPSQITGHGDWTATACPGTDVRRRLADGTIADAVTELLRHGGVDLDVQCGHVAEAAVAAIEGPR